MDASKSMSTGWAVYRKGCEAECDQRGSVSGQHVCVRHQLRHTKRLPGAQMARMPAPQMSPLRQQHALQHTCCHALGQRHPCREPREEEPCESTAVFKISHI